ncbi:hypothetical protein [Grimontia hollisae]|uniref:hypothetical protein n=1 Tax=Grimontia hollisae TaxID=673 RepID=UPI00165DDFCA|nr:hypothetical protein [Grimontia hollisae]
MKKIFIRFNVIEFNNDIILDKSISLFQPIRVFLSLFSIQQAKKYYLTSDYFSYSKIINQYRDVFYSLGLVKPLLRAALLSGDNKNARILMIYSIVADPRCCSFYMFLRLVKEHRIDVNDFVDELSRILSFDEIKLFELYYYKIVDSEYEYSNVIDIIYSNFISMNYDLNVNLYESSKREFFNLPTHCVDIVLKSFILSNKETKLDLINEIVFKRASSKLKTEFFLSLEMVREGMSEKKNRYMAEFLGRKYSNNFVNSVLNIDKEKQLLIINSWGPGDDIRFCTIIPILQELGFHKITFTCDPRLFNLFNRLYPDVSFIPSIRDKVVTYQNIIHFNKLKHIKLHHILDNNVGYLIDGVEQFTLITSLLPILNFSKPTKIDKLRILNGYLPSKELSSFIDDLKLSNGLLVGVSWRSMYNDGVRGIDTFDIKLIDKIFKDTNDVKVISLQYDLCESDIKYYHKSNHKKLFIPPINQKDDFLAVLYLMNQLDLILAPGTTVLEIAGLSTTDTIGMLVDPLQKYRVNKYKDIWFDNLRYLMKPGTCSMEELVNIVKKEVTRIEHDTKNKYKL